MKRQHLFAFLLVFTLIFAVFSLSAFAYDSESTALGEPVFHDDGFLTVSERARVIRALTDAQEKSGVHFGALLYRTAYDGGAYHNRMKGEDSVLLIVWQENGVYRYELFTYGTANDEMTDREADAVLDADDVYNNIKGGRLADGICAFATRAADAVIPDPNAAAKKTARTVLFSVFLALSCALAVSGAVVYRYKKKLKAPIYPLDRYARLNLVDRGDTFLTAHVTRVRVSSPSNSSGGGGGGGGGGGSRGSR